MAQKVANNLCYFCLKMCHQELSKIANLVTLLENNFDMDSV